MWYRTSMLAKPESIEPPLIVHPPAEALPAEPGPAAARPYIIVFGAAVRPDGRPSGILKRRIEGAYSAWRLMPGARLVLTGGLGSNKPAEALVMRRRLIKLGVPEVDLLIEPKSRDTLESAYASAAILRTQPDVGRVWVCTSAFHSPRCRILMALMGFRTGTVHIPPARRLRLRSRQALWTLKEFLSLPWDVLLVALGLGRPPPA